MTTLSEAIRLGAMLAPQGFGQMRDKRGRTCALGAAHAAIGADIFKSLLDVETIVRCPACGKIMPIGGLDTAIAHLNDHHRWTREAIADWLDTRELVAAPAGETETVSRTR